MYGLTIGCKFSYYLVILRYEHTVLMLVSTVNDKSFEGEKFRGLLGSSGMRGKVLQFFPSPPSYIHGFPTLQNSYEHFNENFAFLR